MVALAVTIVVLLLLLVWFHSLAHEGVFVGLWGGWLDWADGLRAFLITEDIFFNVEIQFLADLNTDIGLFRLFIFLFLL